MDGYITLPLYFMKHFRYKTSRTEFLRAGGIDIWKCHQVLKSLFYFHVGRLVLQTATCQSLRGT
jgi:hypothetical protein